MSDIRKSRLYRITVAAVASTPLVPASSNRIGIGFMISNQGTYIVSTESITTLNDGIVIGSGNRDLFLFTDKHGNIVQNSWNCYPSLAGQIIPYIEILDH